MGDSRGNWLLMQSPLHQKLLNKISYPGINMPWCQLANKPLCHGVNMGHYASELIGHVRHKFIELIKNKLKKLLISK